MSDTWHFVYEDGKWKEVDKTKAKNYSLYSVKTVSLNIKRRLENQKTREMAAVKATMRLLLLPL